MFSDAKVLGGCGLVGISSLGILQRSKNVMDKILVNVTKLQVLLSRFELAS